MAVRHSFCLKTLRSHAQNYKSISPREPGAWVVVFRHATALSRKRKCVSTVLRRVVGGESYQGPRYGGTAQSEPLIALAIIMEGVSKPKLHLKQHLRILGFR